MSLLAVLLLASAGLSSAHMHLGLPYCLGCPENNYTREFVAANEIDYNINNPLGEFHKWNPNVEDIQGGYCLGKAHLVGTQAGQPTETWTAGQNATFALSGWTDPSAPDAAKGSTHWGGSCQVGFALLNGGKLPNDARYFVATSFEGACPKRYNNRDEDPIDPADQVFDFTVPACLPAGDQLFWWTWVNREQEMFHNCAVVTIKAASGTQSGGGTACSDLVTMRSYGKSDSQYRLGQEFCVVQNGKEVIFPDNKASQLISTSSEDQQEYPQQAPLSCS